MPVSYITFECNPPHQFGGIYGQSGDHYGRAWIMYPVTAYLMGIFMLIASHGSVWSAPTLNGEAPIIIAHRGASGYLPEHTLEAYRLAIELGADYIEPDLVLTKDGHLIARHDYYLSGTTDVADHPEFADRKRVLDGREDWFVEDFTLSEIRTLKARQGFKGRSKAYDDRFFIPTFDEILTLLADHEASGGHVVGIYPETKHPSHYKAIGLDFVPPLLATLERFGYRDGAAPVFIQSFEPDILRELKNKTDYRLIMLVYPKQDDDPNVGPDIPSVSLEDAAVFAHGVGPSKTLLLDEQGNDRGFIARAHDLGLMVHVWTLRDDQTGDAFATPLEEYTRFFELGVDGIFTDFTPSGVLYRHLTEYKKR